ncbi:hypothetical protein GU926_08555 [Nibribacter ruber]|uniref:Uncharacterized protein n=1 Tax=Nibribacter ruber TaxID=2698458 RepID=A0A6P1NZC0_9BACT|nr:hypothetical protein [Nibribacter ruber]QHL87485.1 hypothetical protein GU926_08555 [Nibribacter ruber]
MKIHLLIFFVASSFGVLGQNLPHIEANTNAEERSNSVIYKAFHDQYDFLISYSEESYWWSNKLDYKILATKDETWYCLRYTSKQKKDKSFSKPFITKQKIRKKKGDLLLDELSRLGFWTLNQDSLNYATKDNDGGRSMTYTVSDGVNYKFEILTKEGFKLISAYEPDYFLIELPEYKQRQKFIEARNVFKALCK